MCFYCVVPSWKERRSTFGSLPARGGERWRAAVYIYIYIYIQRGGQAALLMTVGREILCTTTSWKWLSRGRSWGRSFCTPPPLGGGGGTYVCIHILIYIYICIYNKFIHTHMVVVYRFGLPRQHCDSGGAKLPWPSITAFARTTVARVAWTDRKCPCTFTTCRQHV